MDGSCGECPKLPISQVYYIAIYTYIQPQHEKKESNIYYKNKIN